MKRKVIYSVTIALCLFVAIISTCFAWFNNATKVNATMNQLTAESTTKIRVNFNGMPVTVPINLAGGGDLIPCLPLTNDTAGLKQTAEWIVPSFLPTKRSKRYSYNFNINFSGETGVGKVMLKQVSISAFDSSNPLDVAVAGNLRYAIFLSGEKDTENTLIAHSGYYYGTSGAYAGEFKLSNFDYNFSLRQNIKIVLWLDGYSCPYSQFVGGKANVNVEFSVGD